MSPAETFKLRMELSAAGIPWRACYPNGERVQFATVSESGIRELVNDYRGAYLTGVLTDQGIVLVCSLDEARAALNPSPPQDSPSTENTLRNRTESGFKSGVKTPGGVIPSEPLREPCNASRAPGSPINKPGRAAVQFLQDHLSAGPQASTSILEAARARGISLITLRRAKRPAGVLVEAVRNNEKRVDSWVWKLAR
jgi:hypothetical protein